MHDPYCRCYSCLMCMARRARETGAYSGARFCAQDAYCVARNAAELDESLAFIKQLRGL
jgi:hypothetical protein